MLRHLARTALLAAGLMAAIPNESFAQQPPPLINYQGYIASAAGQPALQQGLEFRIYTEMTGGALVWGPQRYNSVTITEGYFNVLLGPTDIDGRALVNVFTAPGTAERWVSVSTIPTGGGTGGEFLPRQRILSAPYAVMAKRAETAIFAETLGNNTITSETIGLKTIQNANIADDAVDNRVLAINSVDSSVILDGSIQGIDMANLSVPLRALVSPTVTRSTRTTELSLGFSSFTNIYDVQVALSGNGRPVLVCLESTLAQNPFAFQSQVNQGSGTTSSSGVELQLTLNGTVVGRSFAGNGTSASSIVNIPVSSIIYIVTPPQGVNQGRFVLSGRNIGSQGFSAPVGLSMVVIEL